MNFEHHSYFLKDVTMDDATHSVYLAGSTSHPWQAWSEKTKDGGNCQGKYLGELGWECQNLDRAFSERVRCVKLTE
jgi:hypothetical protein